MELRMKEVRKHRKLTLKEVAEMVQVTESAVSKYEKAAVTPSDAVIRLFCEKLHISETWLRTGEGEMEEPDVMADLVARFHLGPAGQALLRAAARALAELDEAAAYALIDDVIAELRSARQAQAEARTRDVEALIDSRLTEDLPPDTKAQ